MPVTTRKTGSVYSRMDTGVPVLDSLLDGGLIEGSMTLAAGGLGSGKTMFGLEFLLAAPADEGPGILVSFGQTLQGMIFPQKQYHDRFHREVREGRLFFQFIESDTDEELTASWQRFITLCRKRGVKRTVIDDFHLASRDEQKRLLPLLQALKRENLTSMLLYNTPLNSTALDLPAQRLAAFADTIFLLGDSGRPEEYHRTLTVMKMRGTGYPQRPLPFTINEKGVVFEKMKGGSRPPKTSGTVVLFHPYNLSADKWDRYYMETLATIRQDFPHLTIEPQLGRGDAMEHVLSMPHTPITLVQVPMNVVPRLSQSGVLERLDGMLPPDMLEAYTDQSLDGCRWQGALYGIPKFIDTKLVLYRRDLLKKYGFAPPGNWDEMTRQARHIMEKEKNPHLEGLIIPAPLLQTGLSDLFIEYLWYLGGDVYNERGGIALDNRLGLEAVAFIRDLAGRHGIVDPKYFPVIFQNSIRKFYSGRGVFMYLCMEAAYYPEDITTQARGKYGTCIFNADRSPATPSGILQGASIGIPKNTRYPDLARKLIRYFADPAIAGPAAARAGFGVSLNTFKEYHTTAAPTDLAVTLKPVMDRGVFLSGRYPYYEIATRTSKELLEVITAGRDPHRALRKIYENLWLFRRQNRYEACVREAAGFIETNMGAPLSLEQVAAHVNISPRHLNRVFKQRTGYSCIDYLLHIRMERAQVLLSTTTHSVNEIAHRCGYHDQNYFSWQFKKRIGLSPTRYRKEHASTEWPGL